MIPLERQTTLTPIQSTSSFWRVDATNITNPTTSESAIPSVFAILSASSWLFSSSREIRRHRAILVNMVKLATFPTFVALIYVWKWMFEQMRTRVGLQTATDLSTSILVNFLGCYVPPPAAPMAYTHSARARHGLSQVLRARAIQARASPSPSPSSPSSSREGTWSAGWLAAGQARSA